VLARLRQGKSVVSRSLMVTGRLAFGSLDTVRVPFKCIDCDFLGYVDASDVVFDRIVDLSGATFERGASFEGATFEGPALFANEAEFNGPAKFRLAVFDDVAAFDGATIDGRADFSLSRFESQASFVATMFKRDAGFAAAALDGRTLFHGTNFERHADFTRTSFGPADFRNSTFAVAIPYFDDATFRGATNFSIAHFGYGVSFAGTQFTKGAAFVASQFCGTGNDSAAYFDGATAGGDVDFSYASFTMIGPQPCTNRVAHPLPPSEASEPPQVVSFDEFASRGAVTLSTTSFGRGHPISMNRIKVKDLRMPIAQTARVDEGEGPNRTEPRRRQVLRVIEAGAKARGDLVTANKATYELHVLASRGYPCVPRLLDLVFYRWIGGYFVRPLHPLAALVALAILFSIVRIGFALRRSRRVVRRSRWSHDRRRWRRLRGVVPWLDRFLHEFFDALGRVGLRRGSTTDEKALAPRLEAMVYRLLIVCTIIGLANSNPTLRQFVDALV
jgi:uncharacterized protein YjbI with pentapeptide repeats